MTLHFLVDDLAFNFVTTFSGALLATTTSDKSIRTFRFTTTPCSIPYPPNLQHPVSELSCSFEFTVLGVLFVSFFLFIFISFWTFQLVASYFKMTMLTKVCDIFHSSSRSLSSYLLGNIDMIMTLIWSFLNSFLFSNIIF